MNEGDCDQEAAFATWGRFFNHDFWSCQEEPDEEIRTSILLEDYSHALAHPWQQNIDKDIRVRISAELFDGRNRSRPVVSDQFTALPNNRLKYTAFVQGALSAYEIYRQVVNTGEHAADTDGGLRGDEFFRGRKMSRELTVNQHVNWETTLYHGKHWIECFVVVDGVLVARSGKFLVSVANLGWLRKGRQWWRH